MINRFIQQLQDFFGISKKEARGALILIILTFGLIWTPFIFRRYILPSFPVTSEPANTQRLDSIVAAIHKDYQKEDDEDNRKTGYKKSPDRPVRYFRFNPNVATIDELTELGIPGFLAKRIEKYRSKGGEFRKKEDLLHIYDFPSNLYQKLEPYIQISSKKEISGNYPKKEIAKPSFPVSDVKTYSKPTIAQFDINTADTTQLVKLRGIGTKLSLRILKFRDALGGFHSVDQFSEIYGLDSLCLSELNKYAKVLSPARKININTASFEELNSHSYLKSKKLASVIINYRTQHGSYGSLEDLKKLKVVDENTIKKLEPYLIF